MPSFTAAVSDWVMETEERQTAVLRESAQRLAHLVLLPRSKGGRLRVDTGFMRASFQLSLQKPAGALLPHPGGNAYLLNETDISFTLSQAQIGQTIYGSFTAEYAFYREYGARGQAPDGMVRWAASQWQTIVSEVSAEAQARAQ